MTRKDRQVRYELIDSLRVDGDWFHRYRIHGHGNPMEGIVRAPAEQEARRHVEHLARQIQGRIDRPPRVSKHILIRDSE